MRVPMDDAFYGLAPSREEAQALEQAAASRVVLGAERRQAELLQMREEANALSAQAPAPQHSHKHGKRGRK